MIIRTYRRNQLPERTPRIIIDRDAPRLRGPFLVARTQQKSAGCRYFNSIAGLKPQARRLPTSICPNTHLLAAGTEIGDRLVVHRHTFQVISIVDLREEDLPILLNLWPLPLQFPDQRLGKGGRTILDIGFQRNECVMTFGMPVKEMAKCPSPAVRDVLQKLFVLHHHDIFWHEPLPRCKRILDQFHSAPQGCVLPLVDGLFQLQRLSIPLMNGEVLGHPFGVPGSPSSAQHLLHKRVGTLMQHQITPIERTRLLVKPEFKSTTEAIGERRQVIGEQPGLTHLVRILHQESCHVPVACFCRVDVQQLTPEWDGRIKDGDQLLQQSLIPQVRVKVKVRSLHGQNPVRPDPLRINFHSCRFKRTIIACNKIPERTRRQRRFHRLFFRRTSFDTLLLA